MASLADIEKELTRERIRTGLLGAADWTAKAGRKRKMTDSKIEPTRRLIATSVLAREVVKNPRRIRAHSMQVNSGLSRHRNMIFCCLPTRADGVLCQPIR